MTSTLELGGLGAEHLDERVVDDLDDLLARRDRAEHLLADRLLGRLVDELADHRQGDVGLEQGDPHLAHRGPDVGLVERAAAAQPVEDGAEAVAQTVEHALPSTSLRRRTRKTPAGETSPASARPLRRCSYPKGMWGRIAARGRDGKGGAARLVSC